MKTEWTIRDAGLGFTVYANGNPVAWYYTKADCDAFIERHKRIDAETQARIDAIKRERGYGMYYRDKDLNLYKILEETTESYVCEGIKGKVCGQIVTFEKES